MIPETIITTLTGRLVQWKEKGEIEEFKRNLEELVKDMGQAIEIQTSVDANITRKIVTDIRGRMEKDERTKLLEGRMMLLRNTYP